MDFYVMLALFIIMPLFASIFYGAGAGRQAKRLIAEYPFSIIHPENTTLSRFLSGALCPTKKRGSPYVYYAKRFYFALSILQIPICLVFFLKTPFPVWYFFSLAIVCAIPKVVFWAMVGILEYKLYKHNKKRKTK